LTPEEVLDYQSMVEKAVRAHVKDRRTLDLIGREFEAAARNALDGA
jgi:hypothetical protein